MIIKSFNRFFVLKALLYVSTAYSNSDRKQIDEIVYPPKAPPKHIIDLCEWMSADMQNMITPKLLDGLPNKYVFTKSLAENLIVEECGDIPVAIVRPSIVASSWKEPFPGWVDNFTGLTGLSLAIYKGVLRHIPCKNDCKADIIPVDSAINLMIAIVWFTAIKRPENFLVYNCTAGAFIPITWGEILTFGTKYSIKYPSSQVFRYPNCSGIRSMLIFKALHFVNHVIPGHLLDGLLYLLRRKRFMVKTYSKLERALLALSPFTTREYKFSIGNVVALTNEMNATDKMVGLMNIRLF